MESLVQLSELGSNLKSIFSKNKTSIAIVSGAVLFKKSGLSMALRIIFKSRFFPLKLRVHSIRKDLINELRSTIKTIKYEEGESILITGEKGIGKSLAIKTAFHHYAGVLNFKIDSREKNLIEMVEAQLLGGLTNAFLRICLKQSWESLIKWHKFLVGRPPIVIIEFFTSTDTQILNYYTSIRKVRYI